MVEGKVPADQIAMLRSAFDKTMADPDFLAEAKTMDLTVTPRGEVAPVVRTVFPLG